MQGSSFYAFHDRSWAQGLARAVLQDCDPSILTSEAMQSDSLSVPAAVLSIGKSAADMAAGALSGLTRRCGAAASAIPLCVMAPAERLQSLAPRPGHLLLVGDHPESTGRNQTNASAILAWLHAHASKGPLLVLLSGGASAYLISPMDGLLRDDLNRLYAFIRQRGGAIQELNSVRKHCELMKGGRLAGIAPSTDVLVISDVMGDPLDVISSGPFVADVSTCADALATLRRLDLAAQFPGIVHHLSNPAHETPKPGDARFAHVRHRVLAGNAAALQSLHRHLRASGVRIVRCIENAQGEPWNVALALRPVIQSLAIGEGVVLGGEPTVDTRSLAPAITRPPGPAVGDLEPGKSAETITPRGGPSQEWCLSLAMILQHCGIAGTAWAVSTDGVDGNSPYAGGWLTSSMVDQARKRGAEIQAFRECHDASSFLEEAAGELFTGPTGVNVNHVACVVRTA